MQRLDEKEWVPCVLSNIADVDSGQDIYLSERILGDVPYVTAGTVNNGIGYFVGNDNSSKAKGSISVVRNGAGVAKAFYHSYEALYGNDCRRVTLHASDDIGVNQFVAASIYEQRGTFSYGRKLGTERLKQLRVMLPVDDEGKPDYAYMEQYDSVVRKEKTEQYIRYLKNRLTELGNYIEIPALNEKEWKPVQLTEIFDSISRGKRLKKSDHIPGDTPYISSKADVNGNDGTCGNTKDVRKFCNCLTIANSGSVGSCFYHPYEFVASDHVTALGRKNTNEFVYLALSLLVSRVGEKYNFNREINDIRIKRERIMVPVDDAGEPDYTYMEQYSKNMMLRKYQQYLDYLKFEKN